MATVGFLRGTRELDVRTEVEGALPPMRADRAKLVQVLVNLLANAVKFTPDGGHVTLRARRLGEARIELAVEDDGVGIPAKELGRIFEAFRQVDGSPERMYGGTGIGLNLVQKLCALMGGEVRVESAPGRGSTFTVTLPIEAPPSLRSTGEHDAAA
jgi:signal transduction histidine kinase